MTSKSSATALKTLLLGIDASNSISDIGALLDRYGDSAAFQILHFGVCKIDDIVVKDVLYTRPIAGLEIAVADFSDDLKILVCGEALEVLRPFNLLSHEFQTGDTALFGAMRDKLAAAGVAGVFAVPFVFDNTIAVMMIRCAPDEFAANQSQILPDLYQIMSRTFARFPTLKKWPDQYQLTAREAEVLQSASRGLSETRIAADLGISPNTVRNHMENCKRKLDARNRTHAISLAVLKGEINPLTDQGRDNV